MSIKGKVKTIPPFYQTASQTGVDFGDGHENPKRFIQWGNLLPFPAAPFSSANSYSLIMTPYSRFIPLHYMKYSGVHTLPGTGGQYLPNFHTLLARRAINLFLSRKKVIEPTKQAAITRHIPWLAGNRQLNWPLLANPFIKELFRTNADTKAMGKRTILTHIQDLIEEDTPVVFNVGSMEGYGAYSRDAMFEAFSNAPRHRIKTMSQRTYNGAIDLGTIFYNEPGGRKLIPLVVACMTPENYVWQKIHYLKTGKIDLSRTVFLVDREIDNPKFPITGLREFYRKFCEPWMVQTEATIMKVPVDFIRENCFMSQAGEAKGNILEYKVKCQARLDAFYTSMEQLYVGRRREEEIIPFFDPEAEALKESQTQVDARLISELDLLEVEADVQPTIRESITGDTDLDEDVQGLTPQPTIAIERDVEGGVVAGRGQVVELDDVIDEEEVSEYDSDDSDDFGAEAEAEQALILHHQRLQRLEAEEQERLRRDRIRRLRQQTQPPSPSRRVLSDEERLMQQIQAEDNLAEQRSPDDWFSLAESLASNPE